jgi:hypothetical protein
MCSIRKIEALALSPQMFPCEFGHTAKSRVAGTSWVPYHFAPFAKGWVDL